MKYIYQEPVITTVTNADIVDDEETRKILEFLRDQQHNVQLSFEDPDNREHVRNLDSARIMNVHPDNTVDIYAFFGGASVKYNKISFLLIRSIRLVASKRLLNNKYKVARFHHLDVAEIDSD